MAEDFLTLPVVRMPGPFCRALRVINPGQPLVLDHIALILSQSPAFFPILEMCFPEMQKEKRADWLIRSMGWIGIRNKMASLIVFRCYEGNWPDIYDESLIEEVLRFETKFAPFGLLGQSRIFMLGLYLKMARLIDPSSAQLREIPEADLLHIFEKNRARSERPDQLLIFLWNLLEVMPRDQIINIIENNRQAPFKKLWQGLSQDQKRNCTKNFLRYGFSISEEDIFTQEVVWENSP